MNSPIVFLVTVLEGGIGKNIVRLANAFAGRGIEVSIWLENTSAGYVEQVCSDVKIVRLSTTHSFMGVFGILRAIRSVRPGFVVVSNERLARLVYRARRYNPHAFHIVAWVHNIYSKHFLRLRERKRLRRIHHIQCLYPKLEAIVAVSKSVADDFSSLTGIARSVITTIYNPVVESSWLNRQIGSESSGLPTIINVGRLVPQKNLSLLLESFALVRQQMPCRLEIVGDGESMAILKAQADNMTCAKDIYFVGHQVDPLPYINRAEVFALTSSYEGFGNVVVESLACGTPVVATQCGGPEEILKEDWLGEVVVNATPENFAQSLVEWLDISVDKARLQQYALNHFSVDVITDQYCELFATLGNS